MVADVMRRSSWYASGAAGQDNDNLHVVSLNWKNVKVLLFRFLMSCLWWPTTFQFGVAFSNNVRLT